MSTVIESQCAICDGPLADWLTMPIDSIKDAPTPFSRFVKCKSCGTGTSLAKPKPDQMAEIYALPQYYTHGESHIKHVKPSLIDKVFTKFVWWADRQKPFDAQELSRRIGAGAVLDIGCGSGATLARFKDLGHDVAGVEPDDAAREQANLRGIRALPGTGEDLPPELEEGSFALVILSHSLEHCTDPMKALKGAASMVAPGGLVYIEVPNCGSLHFQTFLNCSANFDSPRHLWYFKPDSLALALHSVGLIPGEWFYHGMTRHHDRSWREWESTIAERVARRGANGVRHTLPRSVLLFLRELFVPPLRKYDAMGALARKA